jgi:hypothetical protein
VEGCLMIRVLFGTMIYLSITGIVVITVTDHYRLWDRQVPLPLSLGLVVLLVMMLVRAKIRLWLHRRSVGWLRSR